VPGIRNLGPGTRIRLSGDCGLGLWEKDPVSRGHAVQLVVYYPYAFPDGPTSLAVLEALLEMGVPTVEVGYPFSDPIADGPTIQKAVAWALRNRPRLTQLLDDLGGLRRRWPDRRFYLMTYLNPLYRRGLEQAAAASAEAGLTGWIVPDLPLEEAEPVAALLEARGLDLVLLASNNLSDDRLAAVARRSRGFVYAVSTLGVTGVRDALDPLLQSFLERLRAVSPVPVYVGFGISKPEHVRAIADWCDGVIVGSAVVQAVLDRPDRPVEAVRSVVAPLLDTLRSLSDVEDLAGSAGR
jgi:tryptophan synthase alpha chain